MVQVAEGGDPHADRLALRGRGSFEQVAQRYLEEHAKKRNKSWRQADALVAKYLLPRWAKLDIGSIKRTDVKTAQRPGEVAHLHRAHVIDDRWWEMPGAPDAKTGWPGTKNAQSHRVWLSEPVRELLSDVLAARTGRMQQEMRDICGKLDVREKVTPHDLRRTFCSMVTRLGFGRDGMNRITNHKEGGIGDVYDRYKYAGENQRIMEIVARRIITIAKSGDPDNVVELIMR
jgi:integrase